MAIKKTIYEIGVGSRNQITVPQAFRKLLCTTGENEVLYIKKGHERNSVLITAAAGEHELKTGRVICTVCPSKSGIVTLPETVLNVLKFRRDYRYNDQLRAIWHFMDSEPRDNDAVIDGFIELVNIGACDRDEEYNTFCTDSLLDPLIISMFDPVTKNPVYYDDIEKTVKLYCNAHPGTEGAFYISYENYKPGDKVPDNGRIKFPIEDEYLAFDDAGNKIAFWHGASGVYYKNVLKISKSGEFKNGWLGSPDDPYRRPLSDFSIKEEPEYWWDENSRKWPYLDLGDANGSCVYYYDNTGDNYIIGYDLRNLGIDASHSNKHPACPKHVHLYLVAGIYDEKCKEATWRLQTFLSKTSDPGEYVLRDLHVIKEIYLKCQKKPENTR